MTGGAGCSVQASTPTLLLFVMQCFHGEMHHRVHAIERTVKYSLPAPRLYAILGTSYFLPIHHLHRSTKFGPLVDTHSGGVCPIFVHSGSRMTILRSIPSHPYHVGTGHVGLSSTRQISRAPRAKRREAFGESHEGCAASC